MTGLQHHEYRSLADEVLAGYAQKGDDEAFSALIARYVFAVRSRADKYVNTGVDPEDLAQEGLIGLMGAVRSYDADFGAGFKTFAWLCIDRSILSAVKAAYRKKQIPKSSLISIDQKGDDWPLSEQLSTDRTSDPETVVLAREDVSLSMQKVSEQLTPFERKVLKYYLGHHSYSDIAHLLNCSVKSVDNALQRLRRKLR